MSTLAPRAEVFELLVKDLARSPVLLDRKKKLTYLSDSWETVTVDITHREQIQCRAIAQGVPIEEASTLCGGPWPMPDDAMSYLDYLITERIDVEALQPADVKARMLRVADGALHCQLDHKQAKAARDQLKDLAHVMGMLVAEQETPLDNSGTSRVVFGKRNK